MNSEQQRAFDLIKQGNNILLLGQGGSGKSFCIKEVSKWSKQSNINIGITATTGSASILVGGSTVHSFLGIGIGNKTARELANIIMFKRKYIYNRILKLELLVIDEISMLDSKLFDLISELLQILRNNKKPFGSIQIILSGDLFQLPPCKNHFFFKSTQYPTMDIDIVELKENQRQKDDLEFAKILSEIRLGNISKETLKKLRATKKNTEFTNGIEPTIMYSKNVDVDSLNQDKYDALIKTGARSFNYPMSYSSESGKIWAQSCKIPEICQMCVGAQVVLTWNIDIEMGLCNGARGVVTEVGINYVMVKFMTGNIVKINYTKIENEDNKNIWISFIPLRLAYAITINKSQGMTLDCAIIVFDEYISKEFAYGRAYTALSRVRNLKNIQLHNVSEEVFVAHPDVIEFYKNIV